jgi:DNA-binding transcriptional LysR family regulator
MAAVDIRQLRYFLGVVEHGGFGRAAEQLHVAQPSLSQSVARLERELGVPLFHRVGRGVVLSDSGRAFVEPARRVLRDLEAARAAVESVSEKLVGQVDLALMPSQGVEPFSALALLAGTRFPGLTLSAHAAYGREQVLEMVRDGTCELGIVGAPPAPSARGLVTHRIETQEMCLFGRPGQPFTDGELVEHRRLDGQRLVVSPPGSAMRRMADEISAVADVHYAVEVAHRASILPAVLAGTGLAVLSSAWAPFARQCGLAVMRLAPTLSLAVELVHRDAPLTPAAAAFRVVVEEYAVAADS